MGKKAKEHRAKVAKRNRVIAQKKYTMQSALNKMMEKMAQEEDAKNLSVQLNNKELPFETIGEEKTPTLVEFKENHPEIFEPQFDSAGFSVEDREEPKQENEQ